MAIRRKLTVKELEKISYKENHAYLVSRGWHEREGWWYDRPNPNKTGIGSTMEGAIRIASRRDEKLDEVFGMHDGTVEVVCNKCGESCRRNNGDLFMGYYGLINAKVSGGYMSDPLQDGKTYKFSLCEKCLNNIFKKFKIKVEEDFYF